jgi:predicted AAA+ superfamily ATPase
MGRYFERDIYKDMLKWKKRREESSIPVSLEIEGPRQCGKTTVTDKFAKENYKNVIKIDLGDDDDLGIVREWENRTVVRTPDGGIRNFLLLFSKNFVDSPDTVVVIDEIQESSHVHRMIRRMTRDLKSHLIVTGSYLGKVVKDKDFFYPAGDLHSLLMTTLSFEEFLGIFDKRSVWESLDLFGSSSKEDYNEIMRLFNDYLYLGGYPAVISAFLENGNPLETNEILLRILDIFTSESTKYLQGIADKNIFGALFEGVAHLLVNEKRGVFYLTDELDKIVQEKHKSRYSRQSIINVSDWLVTSGVLSQCSLANDCNIDLTRLDARLYFTDVGVARLFLERANIRSDALSGFLVENFVFINLCKMIKKQRLLPNIPAFGMYNGGEMDFIAKSFARDEVYAIEVKSGRSKSNTADALLDKGIVDKVLFAKGNTYGGRNGNKITIPIYLFSRYDFNEGLSPYHKFEESSVILKMMNAFK